MYLDSPFEICPRCNHPVLLDQTVLTCRREQRCGEGPCPLERYFCGRDFASGASEAEALHEPPGATGDG